MSALTAAAPVAALLGPVLAHPSGVGWDEMAVASPVPLVVLAFVVFGARPNRPGPGGASTGGADGVPGGAAHDDAPPPGLDAYDDPDLEATKPESTVRTDHHPTPARRHR